MPAQSEKQRRFMGAVLSYKEGKTSNVSDEIKKAADSMTKKQILDFLKESDILSGEREKILNELEEMYCNSIDEEKSESEKYGRNKLFNLPAIYKMIENSSLLTTQYDKLKEKGKEYFGYHYNEIILSLLFLKYIKPNEELYSKYLEYRKQDIERQEEEEKRKNELTRESKEKEDLEETTSGSSGAYASPVAFAKNEKNWRFGNSSPIEGSKIIEPTTNMHTQGINSYKIKKTIKESNDLKYHNRFKKNLNEERKLMTDPDYLFESFTSLDEEKSNINVKDIDIVNIDGVVKYRELLKNPPENFQVIFTIDTDEHELKEYSLEINLNDLLDYIVDNFGYDEKYNLKSEIGRRNAKQRAEEDLGEPEFDYIQYYISDNFKKAELMENKNLKTEHHIDSRNHLTGFILDHTDKYTESELDSLTYDELYKIYLDVEIDAEIKDEPVADKKEVLEIGEEIKEENENKKNDIRNNEELTKYKKAAMKTLYDKYNPPIRKGLHAGYYFITFPMKAEQDLEKYGIPIAHKAKDYIQVQYNPSTGKFSNEKYSTEREENDKKYHEIHLNEEAKPAALTMLDRIKKDNEDNEEDYFKSLDKSMQEMVKNPAGEGHIQYDYDKDSLKKDEVPMAYKDNTKVDDFVDMNRGRGAQDIKFDIEPSKEWLERFKQDITADKTPEGIKKAWDKYLKKQKAIDLEKKYMRDVETQIQPEHKADQISLNSLKEAKTMTGYYLDKYNTKKFINVNVENIKEVESLNENCVEFRFDGVGNIYNSKIEKGKFKILNENVEMINNFSYYYDKKEGLVVKTLKESTNNKSKLTKEYLDKLKNLSGVNKKK